MERRLFKATVTIGRSAEKHSKKLRDLEEVFTGKLVKSLIIDGNPLLRQFFEKMSGSAPKLVHVSPLYVERVIDGRKQVKCIYVYRDDSNNEMARYSFYIGLVESNAIYSPTSDDVYQALLNLSGHHRFKAQVLDIELISVEEIDVVRDIKKVVSDLSRLKKMKIVFSSPTLLRDPLRRGKHKSLTPTPINIFSTPVYINLYLTGALRWKSFIRTLIILHRLLNEPYSTHKTTKITWVRYSKDKNPIPTLTGYVNLFLNEYYYNQHAKHINIGSLLEETLSTILTLGTGTSRATGFGHITLATPSGS
ncbi:MAG: CRISPR system precrRNA processing endoribonuclease RAMP protein Cas6 [Candidatus Nezhaarchaeales archaeon]